MTHEENSQIKPVPVTEGSETGVQHLTDVDFQDLFQFQDKEIVLGESEAWVLKDRIMPYGNGARRLAVAVGLEFLMPDRIFVEGEWHSNPYIVFRNKKAVGIYIVKHGIAVAQDGIRYLQPNVDYIDIDAIVAGMAMNTQERVVKHTKDGARSCTRTAYEKMKAEWTKPGDPDFFFIPTLDDETGIAFNLNEVDKPGYWIRKLLTDITMLRRNPLRKIQTATDRLVFQKLFPDLLTAFDPESVEIVKKSDWDQKVKSVTFKVPVPTARPLARAMITELGIAMRDNDAAARDRKFGSIINALGGGVTVREIPPAALEAGDLVDEHKETREVVGEIESPIKPCPANMTQKEFNDYWKTEFRKFSAEQKQQVLDASGFTDWKDFKIRKSNFPAIIGAIMEIAGMAPPVEDASEGEITPENARAHMLEWYSEQDGKPSILDAILAKHGLSSETDFKLIPDETIMAIYSEFVDQLSAQGEPQ